MGKSDFVGHMRVIAEQSKARLHAELKQAQAADQNRNELSDKVWECLRGENEKIPEDAVPLIIEEIRDEIRERAGQGEFLYHWNPEARRGQRKLETNVLKKFLAESPGFSVKTGCGVHLNCEENSSSCYHEVKISWKEVQP